MRMLWITFCYIAVYFVALRLKHATKTFDCYAVRMLDISDIEHAHSVAVNEGIFSRGDL